MSSGQGGDHGNLGMSTSYKSHHNIPPPLKLNHSINQVFVEPAQLGTPQFLRMIPKVPYISNLQKKKKIILSRQNSLRESMKEIEALLGIYLPLPHLSQ